MSNPTTPEQYLEANFNIEKLIEIASEHGTPTYVYNQSQIINNYLAYKNSFEQNKIAHYLICFAVKANSNLAILNLLAKQNAGFDIVSLGELHRVLKAGGNPHQVVFSGVGKQDFEIKAALEANIHCFNIESEPELELINQIAKQLNKQAPISIRVNPNIDAKSHPYISTGLKEHKFGIAIENAEQIYNYAKDLNNINIIGIDCHIGSQLTELNPIKQTCLALNHLLSKLASNNIHIDHLNLGGGLGIDYEHKFEHAALSATAWVQEIIDNINFTGKILLEPGRSITGNAGVLLTKVIYNKQDKTHDHNFTIIDAAMNDLLRPALYSAEHQVVNIKHLQKRQKANHYKSSIVGPVCESSDIFSKVEFDSDPGDILAILDTGAYGFTMSSNYNSRLKPAEVLLENNSYRLIRSRETYHDLYNAEII